MKSTHRFIQIAIAAGAAAFAASREASAARIINTSVDAYGRLVVEYQDPEHGGKIRNYTLKADASAYYVCARQGEALRDARSMAFVEEPREKPAPRILLDERGRPGWPLMLGIPREHVRLTCPSGYIVELAKITYTRIRLVGNGDPPALGRDAFRTFIAVERDLLREAASGRAPPR